MDMMLNALTGDSRGLDAPQAAPAGKGSELGKQDFMRLLVAQIQNQDPLNPSDSTQMVSQLAQFAGVEALADIRTTVTGLNAGLQSLQAASLTGRRVTVDTDVVKVSADNREDIAVEVAAPPSVDRVTVMLTDPLGQPAATRQLACQGSEPVRFSLAQIAGSDTLPEGIYAVSAAADDVPLPVSVNSRIRSISLMSDNPDPRLDIAGVGSSVPLSLVRRIE